MGQISDVQQFIDDLDEVRTPFGLEHLLIDVSKEMGFDIYTMFHHVDLSSVVPTYRHMQRGELVGISTAPLSWSEFYRDHDLIQVDPRVLATRRTVAPFLTEEIGRLIRITPAQRDVVEGQRRAGIGDSFMVPIHVPGEPSGSCTFSMAAGRDLPRHNLAMAHWVGAFAFQAGRTIVARARQHRATADRPRLTERQLQCAVLVGRGLGEVEIARRLGISAETVKRHLKEARNAYGVAKSIQLVTHCLRDGHFTLRDLFSEPSVAASSGPPPKG